LDGTATLVEKLYILANSIDVMRNSNKTVFSPKRRHNIVTVQFPNFTFGLSKEQLRFVQELKYLGTNRQSDDEDIL